jgi:hypothetical protein
MLPSERNATSRCLKTDRTILFAGSNDNKIMGIAHLAASAMDISLKAKFASVAEANSENERFSGEFGLELLGRELRKLMD